VQERANTILPVCNKMTPRVTRSNTKMSQREYDIEILRNIIFLFWADQIPKRYQVYINEHSRHYYTQTHSTCQYSASISLFTREDLCSKQDAAAYRAVIMTKCDKSYCEKCVYKRSAHRVRRLIIIMLNEVGVIWSGVSFCLNLSSGRMRALGESWFNPSTTFGWDEEK